MSQHPGPSDEELLTRLAMIARAVDPPPQSVSDLAKAAFAFRDLDSELATLVNDSAEELSSVRHSVSGTRLLEFASNDLEIDLQFSSVADRRSLIGQLQPPPDTAGTSVTVEASSGQLTPAAVDSQGRFEVSDLPLGTIRLRCRRPGLPIVVTSWITFSDSTEA